MAMLWAGRVITGLVTLFLLFDATVKVLALPLAVDATRELGYAATVVVPLGVLQLLLLLLYLVPSTAVLGAVLWTGYLGGAVATHLRVGAPLLGQTLFPTYVGVLLWGGLWLRDTQLRSLLSVRRRSRHCLSTGATLVRRRIPDRWSSCISWWPCDGRTTRR